MLRVTGSYANIAELTGDIGVRKLTGPKSLTFNIAFPVVPPLSTSDL